MIKFRLEGQTSEFHNLKIIWVQLKGFKKSHEFNKS